MAVLRDNKEMVEFLVDQGANVDVLDKGDHTPAAWAALSGLNDGGYD